MGMDPALRFVGGMLAMFGLIDVPALAQRHQIKLSVESRLGNTIGDGTIWSTFVGSGGPINCSHLWWTPINPEMDLSAYPVVFPAELVGSTGANSVHPATCSANTLNGVGMTLFPSLKTAPRFIGWNGAACSSAGAGACTIIPTAASPAIIEVTARFRQPRITVTTTATHYLGGALKRDNVKVTAQCTTKPFSPPNIAKQILYVTNSGSDITGLPDDCDYHVTVTANPTPKPRQWGGVCNNTSGPVCLVTALEDVTVTVDYTK